MNRICIVEIFSIRYEFFVLSVPEYSSNNQLMLHPETCTHTCHPCGKKFINEDELVAHFESSHDQSLRAESFDSLSNCDQASKTTRDQEAPIPHACKICNASFRNKSSLSEHRWTHSAESLPWRCDKCDKVFPFQSRLKKHELCHIEKCKRTIRYKCSQCEKTFFRKNDLWSHEKARGHRALSAKSSSKFNREMNAKSVHQKGYECSDCGKVLASSGSLFNHRQSLHHGGDTNKRFSCPECGDRFALKQKLVSHFQRSHFKKK